MSFEGIFLQDQIKNTRIKFTNTFGNSAKSQVVVTPASLILLGDHTHYNQGTLLSAAINKFCIVQIKKRTDKIVNITNADSINGRIKTFSLLELQLVEDTGYKTLTGLIKILYSERMITSGFDCVFTSAIPECIGLGAMAALEIGFITALKKVFKISADIKDLFKIIRTNELNLIGKISNKAHLYNLKYAREGKLLFIDLRTLEYKPVPLVGENFNIVICDTGEKIVNPQDICNERISECEVGVKGLRLYIWGIKNLRDVEQDFLLRHIHMLPKKIFTRVLYNVKERDRTINAIAALKTKQLNDFGNIITESHLSLKDDYELSCEKCDFLVDEAGKIDGIFGSKMISCSPNRSTFHIVDKIKVQTFSDSIKRLYREKFNEELTTYNFSLTEGTRELKQKEIQVPMI